MFHGSLFVDLFFPAHLLLANVAASLLLKNIRPKWHFLGFCIPVTPMLTNVGGNPAGVASGKVSARNWFQLKGLASTL